MRRNIIAGAAIAVALTAGGTALAASGGSDAGSGSRLDDGKDLLPQAKISEQQAIAAAQTAATGALNEVDLEQLDGTLVFNVDVGSNDVKVDATSGRVVRVDRDD
jgi:uncharacterized membrane protein YkoI